MHPLIVVDNPQTWPLKIPGVEIIAARSYLTDPQYARRRGVRVFNLCRSYQYQTTGYYVSLLAMARGHRPLPNNTTIQDMRSLAIKRLVSEELEESIQRSLKPVQASSFTLSIYFGKNLAKRYDKLSSQLFRLFRAPFLRGEFERKHYRWRLKSIRAVAGNDLPEAHREFAITAARAFFDQKRERSYARRDSIYSVAILHNPGEPLPPSNQGALDRFADAAKRLQLNVEFIQKDDYERLAEFDALFIRETTAVNHHTYRFARRAAAEGLVVIDDPESILKCTNKVFLAELLDRHGVPQPKTLIVHRDNRETVIPQLGLPCVLKQPDSAFSLGVRKFDSAEALQAALDRLFETSELVIAQEFLPTDFDWRVGVLDRKPLYACRYHMARAHWQIALRDENGNTREGKVVTVPLAEVPAIVLKTALRAAQLIGKGFYGVDLKQVGRRVYVIEINDNPSIDHGFEDRVLKRDLYHAVMQVFLQRIVQSKAPNGNHKR
ncbi:MAG: RimK family protein [Phycisphaerales bacterium]|nr:MAG: RimK family protein [Phycisphaerales bacterium]